eukprot:CAMPEP_0172455904 /NCGR_PEP_ID=MMETSP1065-20121228/12989_1 /TAXON_ID=265537 /ORGANISM="Amphiprora paludosa, Strain CCMP125" /LENGTH=207 /DNA_ID=CAMNT_0013208429 /DNA_START=103 /DNA_END=723 /DNA_ORIENTATION=+
MADKKSSPSKLLSLNEKAIRLIRNTRRYDMAEHILHKALLQAEDDYTNDVESKQEIPSGSFSEDITDTIMVGALAPIPQPVYFGDMGTFSLYSNAMTMVEVPTTGSRRYREYANNLLYCLLFYNLGLARQLQGLTQGQDISLTTALQAYETALGLLGDLERDPFVQTLELAILNNCGHVHYQLFQTQHVHSCLRLMKNTLCEITNGW